MEFMISRKEKPNNHPIHTVHTDLESFILYSDMNPVDDDSQLLEISKVSDVISSVEEDLISEEKENNVECLQRENSPEKIFESMQKTKIIETVGHP